MADLGYLLAQRRAAGGAGNSGASELGALLGGGGQARTQQIYNQAAMQGAHEAEFRARARKAQQDEAYKEMQRSTRHRAADRVRSTNPGLADAFEGWDDPALATKAQDEAQKTQFSQDAWAARNGDPNALNRMLMVIQGKPVEFQRSLGEGQYTPNAYDTTSQPVVSEIGRAIIGEKGAQAGSANAAAAQHYAGADLERARTDEVTGKGAAGAKRTSLTAAQEKIFNKPVNDETGTQKMDSQGRPVFAADPDLMTQFQQFRDRPAATVSPNADKALSQFTSMKAQEAAPPPGAFTLADAFGAGGKPAAEQSTKIPVAKKMVNGKLWYKYNDGTTAPAE
jgi:hypothetical protein